MVGAVTKVVEPAFSVGEETTGCGAHAIAVGAFDDVGCGRESSSAGRVVLWAGPKAKDDQVGMMILPPFFISNLGWRGPEDGRDGRFRISNFGMRKGIWGGMWTSR